MRRGIIKRALFVAFIFGSLLIYAYLASRGLFGMPCIFYEITHLYCPGCGASRLFLNIFTFKFYAAFRMNPLLFVLLPFIAIYLVIAIYYYIIGKPNPIDRRIPRCVPFILVLILIIYGILRNIPFFSYLAPTPIN